HPQHRAEPPHELRSHGPAPVVAGPAAGPVGHAAGAGHDQRQPVAAAPDQPRCLRGPGTGRHRAGQRGLSSDPLPAAAVLDLPTHPPRCPNYLSRAIRSTAAASSAAAVSRSASETSEAKLNRSAVWATVRSTPMALSTADGSSEPAAQAEPDEHTIPRRSSSSSTDSQLVTANQNEATLGSRRDGCPVSCAVGISARILPIKASRSAVTRSTADGLAA